jgi:hypothetical protein
MIDYEKLIIIKNDYQKRSIKLPNFIDTQSNLDYSAYAHYRDILNCILALIKSDNHTDRHIKLLLDKANDSMDNIFKIYDSKSTELKYLLISENIISFIEDLQDDLINAELYEAVANLQKFNENFYRQNE